MEDIEPRPDLNDELDVSVGILGRCPHLRWSNFRDQHKTIHLLCQDCNAQIYFGAHDSLFDAPPKMPEREFLRRKAALKIATDELVANLVEKQIERAGWSVLMRIAPDGYVYRIQQGPEGFVSATQPTRAKAICDAAAKFARSGRFSREA